MSRRPRAWRDDNLQCAECRNWFHFSRFRQFKRWQHGSVLPRFATKCRTCEQTERVETKHGDPALAKVTRAAGAVARRYGLSATIVLNDLGYLGLVPYVRAAMEPETTCLNCGHHFLGERDIQFDHREPPRHVADLARLHARNITILCASCNNTKGHKPYAIFLDDQEAAGQSARVQRYATPELAHALELRQLTQMDMFGNAVG